MNKKVKVKHMNIGDAFIFNDHTYVVDSKTAKHVHATDSQDGDKVSFSNEIEVEVV